MRTTRVLATIGVVAVLAACGTSTSTATPSPPSERNTATETSPSERNTVTAAPSSATGPSQSPQDAARDQVPREIAALPLAARLRPYDLQGDAAPQTRNQAGLWIATHLDLDHALRDGESCPESSTVEPFVHDPCHDQYNEILQLSPDGTRIVRAFPIPYGLIPEWILSSEHAVYCGREGDGMFPVPAVVRIDLGSGTLQGEIYQGAGGEDMIYPPAAAKHMVGRWTVHNEPSYGSYSYGAAELTATALVVGRPSPDRELLYLDPVTLRPLP